MQPHRRQPTSLPRPWDSPGKNTGVGCHFLLQCMKVESESEVAHSCLTLSDPMDCSLPSSSVHGILQARVLEWGAIAFSGKTVWSFLKKLKIWLSYDPEISALSINLKETKSGWQRVICTPTVTVAFFKIANKQHKCPSTDKWVKKIHIYNGILFSSKDEGNSDICNDMDGLWGQYAKLNKLDKKRQISMIMLMHTGSKKKKSWIHRNSRMVVARGWS